MIPGADAISKTFSFGCGAKDITGKKELAPCNIYCPDKYSGVAPTITIY
jgi:hypothetical protein